MKLNNLNKREKFLIVLIAVLLSCYGLYEYVYFPLVRDITTYTATIETDLAREAQLIESSKSNDALSKRITGLLETLASLEKTLPSTVQQEEMTVTLLDAFPTSKFQIKSLSFAVEDKTTTEDNTTAKKPLNEVLTEIQDALDKGVPLAPVGLSFEAPASSSTVADGAQTQEVAASEAEKPTYRTVNAELTVDGDYGDLESAIMRLESNERLVFIDRLTITKSGEAANQVTALLSLKFPVYTDFVTVTESKYQIKTPLGVNKPFNYLTVGSLVSQIQHLAERPIALPDFSIQLSPITSDASTIMLNKTPDRVTSVYSNQNKMISGTLELKKSGDGVSYRYQVGSEAYPASGYAKMSPNGKDIVVEVLSKSRNDALDQAGLKLTVKNDTGYKVIFYVYFEDQTSPRLVIANPSADILVEKK